MKDIRIGQKEIIHFIGIGGIGMSGLAQVMKTMGFKIQGSDQNKSSSAAGKYGSDPRASIINPGVADTDEMYNQLKSASLPKINRSGNNSYFGNDALSGNVISEGYYGG